MIDHLGVGTAHDDPWNALLVEDPFGETDDLTDEIIPNSRAVAAESIVVVGAGGGVGASLVASGLALSQARHGTAPLLIDLDAYRGDLAGSWGVPDDRTVADLGDVVDEVDTQHVGMVAHRHETGVHLVLGPPSGSDSPFTTDGALRRLISACAGFAPPIVDLGSGLMDRAASIAQDATVVVVAAPTVASARRTRGFEEMMRGWRVRRSLVVLNRGSLRDELSTRAFARAIGRPVVAEIPRAMRDAHMLGAGEWPGRGRRAICSAIDGLAELIAAG